MDSTKRTHVRALARGKSQSYLPLTIPLTVILIIGGVQGNACPDHVTRVAHGQTAIHNDVCYLFVNKELYWDKARDACWDLGGEMLAIEDSDTVEFIKKTLDSSQLGWDRNGVWLGAREESGKWRWTNGRVMAYTNWADKQPSTVLGRTILDCVQMRQEDGWKWHNSVCSLPKFHYNYICQFPLNKPGEAESRVSTDHNEESENSSNLAIFVGVSVILLLIIGTVFLVLSLHHRCSQQNGSDTSVSISNNVYSSTRTTHPDYQTPSVSTDQTPFSSNDRLYMMPCEVVKPSNNLHAVNLQAKSCNCCHAQTGASNSACLSQTIISALEACGDTGRKQEPELPLMTAVGKTNCEFVRTDSTTSECLHCCTVSQGVYVDMNSQELKKKVRHAKEEEPKHIYNNVDHRDGGYVNHYEVL